MKIASREDLRAARLEAERQMRDQDIRVLVCAGTGCVASGSEAVYEEFRTQLEGREGISLVFAPHDQDEDGGISFEEAEAQGWTQAGTPAGIPDVYQSPDDKAKVAVCHTGCQGICEMGPLVRIQFGEHMIQYVKVQPSDVSAIIFRTIMKGEVIDRLLYHQQPQFQSPEDIPFIARQTRIVLSNCGKYEPDSLSEYLYAGGFRGLEKALFEMTPEQVIAEVSNAGLRGRGGAGFPTGRKWSQVAAQKDPVRYVVCNGDEGDPGAFMDGSVMEGDPFKMIEGMMIAAYAVGARDGYIYVRAEYPLSVARLTEAIEVLEKAGLLGGGILGSSFSFRLHINRGAGAFVCGEGSALTASIEGKRGMPRVKPPRTVEHGLWAKPTVLNNVETYANVPRIITDGADWFASIGSPTSHGTKTFSITGAIQNTGLIEVPMGTTLREIIYDIGGGIKDGGTFKAVQIGGPSGGCLTEREMDVGLDFESVKKYDAIIGSGGLVVLDQNSCMVEVARFFMSFTQRESCGKCTPCREGTKRMLEIMQKIVDGKAEMEDLDNLEELAQMVRSMSLCGLGKSAPLPVISTIHQFREEYVEHIVEKRCRAHVCAKLARFVIDQEKCVGCGKCVHNCPAGAIIGARLQPHQIVPDACIRCGTCQENCAFDAIYVEF